MLAETAADKSIFVGIVEGNHPWFFGFVDKGNVIQIDDKGPMDLYEDIIGQVGKNPVKRNGDLDFLCNSMNDGMFLTALNKKDLIQMERKDLFWRLDQADGRCRFIIGSLIENGKFSHGDAPLCYEQNFFVFSHFEANYIT